MSLIMHHAIKKSGSGTKLWVWLHGEYDAFNPNSSATIGGVFTGGALQEVAQNKTRKTEHKK